MYVFYRLIVMLLPGFAMLLPINAMADTGSPYVATVPVSNTSPVKRDQAFTVALANVLMQVSGGQDFSNKPGYAKALNNASGMVQHYQFSDQHPPELWLQVSFDQGAVQRLIKRLRSGRAGLSAPVLLLVRRVGDRTLDASALSALASAAGQRGYTVIYPDHTLTTLSTIRLMRANPLALAILNSEYHTDRVLLGRLGHDRADWILVNHGKMQQWTDQDKHATRLLRDAGNILADHLDQQMASCVVAIPEVKVWVSGIDSAMAYAELLVTLRTCPAVLHMMTMGARGDGVLLGVESKLPLSVLRDKLVTDSGRLWPAPPHVDSDMSLFWKP